jgi:hypothetical protein
VLLSANTATSLALRFNIPVVRGANLYTPSTASVGIVQLGWWFMVPLPWWWWWGGGGGWKWDGKETFGEVVADLCTDVGNLSIDGEILGGSENGRAQVRQFRVSVPLCR